MICAKSVSLRKYNLTYLLTKTLLKFLFLLMHVFNVYTSHILLYDASFMNGPPTCPAKKNQVDSKRKDMELKS